MNDWDGMEPSKKGCFGLIIIIVIFIWFIANYEFTCRSISPEKYHLSDDDRE